MNVSHRDSSIAKQYSALVTSSGVAEFGHYWFRCCRVARSPLPEDLLIRSIETKCIGMQIKVEHYPLDNDDICKDRFRYSGILRCVSRIITNEYDGNLAWKVIVVKLHYHRCGMRSKKRDSNVLCAQRLLT